MNIRTLRKQKKMTVQETAYRCNIERSNLSRIEAGKTNLTVKTICQIAEALGVDFEELVVGDKTKENNTDK